MNWVPLYIKFQKLWSLIGQKKFELYLHRLVRRGLRLGKNVAILEGCFLDPSHCFLISIGNNTVLCPNVRLIAHDASTKKFLGYTKIGRIDIRENCFIGDSAIILPNVTIGPNSIIGAGAVVTKDVPPGTVAAGNPARVICSVEEYLSKIKALAQDKEIFGEDYFIENLDEKKRKRLLESVGDGIGFIV